MALLDRFWTLLDQLRTLLNQLGTLLDHLVALLDLMGTLLNWGAILANWRPSLQKENARNTRFTKYRNTVWKYEKYKNGVCYAIVPSREFWKCVIWGATVEWPRVNKQRNLGPTCQKSAKMCIFGAKNADFDPKILILGPKSKTLCTTTMVCQYGNFFVLTVLHRKLLGGRRGQFWAQNTRIFSLRSQFRTFFWADRPGFNGKMLRQRPDASVDVSGHAFGAFLADWRPIFQREIREIHFLRNTEIRFENARNTKSGVHHGERRAQSFPSV